MNIFKVSCLALLAFTGNVMAESNPDAKADADADASKPPYHPVSAPYHPGHYTPKGYHHEPAPYHPKVAPYEPKPCPSAPYNHVGPYGPQPHRDHYYGPPRCSKGNPKKFCLEDYEYPTYEIQSAIEYHYDAVQKLYKDVVAVTENSVDDLETIGQETYLCPSETAYVQPLRAVNVHGRWRIIVNDVNTNFATLTQTARIEECTTPEEKCRFMPRHPKTRCIQKNIYHRFLVYDPFDECLPFAIESFQLPSTCACFTEEYIFPEED